MDNGSVENEENLEAADTLDAVGPVKKKTRFWRGFFTGAIITLLLFFLFIGGVLLFIDHEVSQSAQNEEAQTGVVRRSLDYKGITEKLALIKRAVDRYFLFPTDVDEMETGIYRGMVEALDDPYTVYYTPEEYEKLTEETGGQYSGIGVLVNQNLETGIVTILKVFENSPAEEAGILKGDILYKVNGIDASSQDLDLLVSEQIRGEDGTFVDIVVLRDDEEISMQVARGTVDVETVYAQMLSDGKTGYVDVGEFDLVTADQFAGAIDELEDEGMTQLVIDLKDNPDGVVDTAVSMIAYILPDDLDKYDGTIISTADKNGRGMRFYLNGGEICFESDDGSSGGSVYPKKDEHEVDIPIAVLVNGNSASASELMSGALRDYGAAKLVGTTTFGKGIVQSIFPLGDGSALKITTSHYYTPSGQDLQENGLEPDLEVEYEIPEDPEEAAKDPYNNDNQIAAAVELLNSENRQP